MASDTHRGKGSNFRTVILGPDGNNGTFLFVSSDRLTWSKQLFSLLLFTALYTGTGTQQLEHTTCPR